MAIGFLVKKPIKRTVHYGQGGNPIMHRMTRFRDLLGLKKQGLWLRRGGCYLSPSHCDPRCLYVGTARCCELGPRASFLLSVTTLPHSAFLRRACDRASLHYLAGFITSGLHIFNCLSEKPRTRRLTPPALCCCKLQPQPSPPRNR